MVLADKDNPEIQRLAGNPPLRTVLTLMIGPFASQITSTLYGIINTIWISRYVGEVGMAAVATDIAWEGIARAFGLFLLVAGSTQISALFGRKLFSEAEQVICDLLRAAVVCGMIVPAVLLPINKPLSRWFGADEETVKEAFDYMLPICAGNVFTCIFLTSVGFLQAEGRTLLVGIVDFVALGFGMFLLNPLFLGVFKTGIAGPAYSTIIADGVPGIIITILYFSGKFGVKPKLSGLLKPFSKHTWQALGVGSSMLMSQISLCIPGIFVRKLIGLSVSSAKEYDLAMAGFNVICRYGNVTNCVVIAISTGYAAAASYAYAAQNYKRYLRLSIHLNWTSIFWCAITSIIAISIPRQISMVFGDSEDFLNWSAAMMRISNYGGFVMFARFTFQSMLQAQQSGCRAMIISVTSNFVVIILGAGFLYITDKHNAVRLIWVYFISYTFGLVFGAILLARPLINTIKLAKQGPSALAMQNIEDDSDEVKNIPEL
jgi:Na+-driven multidrug efflux pump